MIDRCVSVAVGAGEYPICLTLKATKALTQKFGGLDKVSDALASADFITQLDTVLWLLSLLLEEGTAVYAECGAECAAPPSPAQLERMTPGQLIAMKDSLFDCMALGMGREVPAKNRETGQTVTQDSLPG